VLFIRGWHPAAAADRGRVSLRGMVFLHVVRGARQPRIFAEFSRQLNEF